MCVYYICRNVNDRTKEIYHDNIRMSEALTLHSARVEELEIRTQKLELANKYIYSVIIIIIMMM